MIRRVAAENGPARLADFFPSSEAFLLETDGQERWLVAQIPDGARYQETRYALGAVAQAVDQTVFYGTEQQWVEAERYTTRGGPNLHREPLALPGRMELGQRVAVARGWVTLLFVGTLEKGGQRCRGLILAAEEGPQRRFQWMVEGLGVVARGPPGGPKERWILGSSQGWPRGIPPEILALERRELPEGPPGRPLHSLF